MVNNNIPEREDVRMAPVKIQRKKIPNDMIVQEYVSIVIFKLQNSC